MNDLEKLCYCIGVEFKRMREARTIILDQRSYIKEVLKHFNVKKIKISQSSVQCELLKFSDEKFGDVQKEMEGVPYRAN